MNILSVYWQKAVKASRVYRAKPTEENRIAYNIAWDNYYNVKKGIIKK